MATAFGALVSLQNNLRLLRKSQSPQPYLFLRGRTDSTSLGKGLFPDRLYEKLQLFPWSHKRSNRSFRDANCACSSRGRRCDRSTYGGSDPVWKDAIISFPAGSAESKRKTTLHEEKGIKRLFPPADSAEWNVGAANTFINSSSSPVNASSHLFHCSKI